MEHINPITTLITDILEERYDGVTFSDEIVGNIEKKIAPMLRTQVEEHVATYIAELFSPKKPTRKPRKKTSSPKASPTKPTNSEENSTKEEPVVASVEQASPASAPTSPFATSPTPPVVS